MQSLVSIRDFKNIKKIVLIPNLWTVIKKQQELTMKKQAVCFSTQTTWACRLKKKKKVSGWIYFKKMCHCVTDCVRLRSFSSTDRWGPTVCMGGQHLRPAGHRQQEQPAQPFTGHDRERKVRGFGNMYFPFLLLAHSFTHWLCSKTVVIVN